MQTLGENRKYFYFLLLILIFLSLFPYINTGYTTNDDMWNALINYDDFVRFAKNQGRYHFMSLHALVALGAHVLGDHVTVKSIALISIVMNGLLFGMVIWKLTRDEILALFCLIFWVVFMQDNWDHFLITSSPLIYTLPLSLFFVSILFFILAIEKTSMKYMILSAIIYLGSLQFSEMFVSFVLVYVVIFFFKTEKGVRTFAFLLPHVSALSIFLIIYVIFRINYPSQYSGASVDFSALSLWDSFRTLVQYSTSCFPSYFLFWDHWGSFSNRFSPFFLNIHLSNIVWDNLLTWPRFVLWNIKDLPVDWIVRGLISSFALATLLKKSLRIFMKKNYLGIFFIGIGLVFLPNIPHALTSKYQNWVIAAGTRSYVGTYYSFFGMVLVLAGLMFLIYHRLSNRIVRGVYLSAVALSIFVASVFTSIGNYSQLKSKVMSHKKWEMVDKFVQSDQFHNIPEKSIIYASSLINKHNIGIANTSETYWQRYTYEKTGKKMFFAANANRFLDLIKSYPESNLYFIKYSQDYNNPEQYLIFSEVERYDFSPGLNEDGGTNIYSGSAYVFNHSINTKHLVIYNAKNGVSVVEYDDKKRADSKETGVVVKGSDIDLNSILVTNNLDFYEINRSALKHNITVTFCGGFYPREGSGKLLWHWSKRDSLICVENPYSFELKVTIRFILASGLVNDRRITLKSTNLEREFVPTKTGQTILIDVNLKPGKNILAFHAEAQKAYHLPTEKRDLYFGIFNFQILSTEKQEQLSQG